MNHFNVIAYIVSSVVFYLIGWVWYSALFGKPWAEQVGMKMNEGANPVLPMLGQLIANFLLTLGVYMVVMQSGNWAIQGPLVPAFSIILYFIIPLNAANLLFLKKPKLFLIDAGYYSVGTIIAAFILSNWK